jgi:tRNA modification GTPase
MEDTIAAISTPVGEGGIAIIRVSGPLAFNLADRVFHSRRGRPSEFPTHTIHFGTAGINGDAIDQVMLTIMRAPRTYTREDTIEINCHGGILTARKLLSLCLQNGVRLAEPGEFTKRAFLN